MQNRCFLVCLLSIASLSTVLSQDTLSHSERKIQYLNSSFNVCLKDSAAYERYVIYCPTGAHLYVDHVNPELIRNDCSMVEFDEGIKLLADGEITFYFKKKRVYVIDTYKGGYLQTTKYYKRNRIREEIIYDYSNNVNQCSCTVNAYSRKGIVIYGGWYYVPDYKK
jgi:hypothetical protein